MKVPLAVTTNNDNDITMTLCDATRCVGFTYWDRQGIQASEFLSSSATCDRSGPYTGWQNVAYEIWDVRFELTPSRTGAITWSAALDKGMSKAYSYVLKPSSGLWITACRNDPFEQYDVRFVEVTVRKIA